jgi:hypothetical protein
VYNCAHNNFCRRIIGIADDVDFVYFIKLVCKTLVLQCLSG